MADKDKNYKAEKVFLGYNKKLDTLAFLVKNMYNTANFTGRQPMFYKGFNRQKHAVEQDWSEAQKELEKRDDRDFSQWPWYNNLYHTLKKSDEYKDLPSPVAQQAIKEIDSKMREFFNEFFEWLENPDKFDGIPQMPKYKNSSRGKKIAKFPSNAFKVFEVDGKKANSKIRLSTKQQLGTYIWIKSRFSADFLRENLKFVRVVPMGNKNYKAELVYEAPVQDCSISDEEMELFEQGKHRFDFNDGAFIDLGINNLITCLFGGDWTSLIINGKVAKSFNQFYNKKRAKLQSKMKNTFITNQNDIKISYKSWPNKGKPIPKSSSAQLSNLTIKRNHKINNYFHEASTKIINELVARDVKYLVVGYNKGWKKKANLGKKTNQKFVQLPFRELLHMLEYKAKENGIRLILTEESYTSKVDHLAWEKMEHQENYLGSRRHRGLFVSSTGIHLNADTNGCIGIARKVVSKSSFEQFRREVVDRGCVAQPSRWTPPLKPGICG